MGSIQSLIGLKAHMSIGFVGFVNADSQLITWLLILSQVLSQGSANTTDQAAVLRDLQTSKEDTTQQITENYVNNHMRTKYCEESVHGRKH